MAFPGQAGEHLLNGADAQRRFATASDQLEGLADELDLTNAARASLDVVLQFLLFHFAVDEGLHVAQGLEGAEIDVAAVDEGPQPLHEARPLFRVAPHGPRLDHGIALPFAALGLIVFLQGVETHHKRAAVAIGAQAHVHAVDPAFVRMAAEDVDQVLAQAGEEFRVAEGGAPAARLALLGIAEYEVDVRREIELSSPQLAHGQHDQRLLVAALFVPRGAQFLAVPTVEALQGRAQQVFRKQGQVAQGLIQGGPAAQVAPGDARHLAAADFPQDPFQILPVAGGLQGLVDFPKEGLRVGQQQIAAVQQFRQHGRVAYAILGNELAQGPYPLDIAYGFGMGGRFYVGSLRGFQVGGPFFFNLSVQFLGMAQIPGSVQGGIDGGLHSRRPVSCR